MSPSDVIAITAAVLSGLSLIVSIWAAYKATRLGDYELRLSNRAQLHNMLLEIDREVLHDPTLSAMFRSSPSFSTTTSSAANLDKLETYVMMYVNLFELTFAQFKEIKNLTSSEKEVSEAWDRFIVSFFEDCPLARSTWTKYRDTHYESFRDYIDGLMMNANNQQPQT